MGVRYFVPTGSQGILTFGRNSPFRGARWTWATKSCKKCLSPPQRRRDAERGSFVFKALRLRDSAVKKGLRRFHNSSTSTPRRGYKVPFRLQVSQFLDFPSGAC